ncbi:GNAT family N-acetyltransferase [Candidatus Nitrospira salsa]|nr:MAG: hypothetical protein NPIRA01_08830 [Nitrospirales bacterium]
MKSLERLPVKDHQIPLSVGSGVSVVPVNKEVIAALTQLHLSTFADYIHARIGEGYVRAFLDWFRCPENGVALVAINAKGEPLGYVVGATVGYVQAMNRDLFWVGLGAMMMRPWLCFEAGIRKKVEERVKLASGYSACPHQEPTIPEPTMSLVSLAVLPSVRRQKIGLRLVESFEAQSKQLAARSLRLSVYPSNVIARRFYEQCGWQPFSGQVRNTGEMYYYRIINSVGDFSRLSNENKSLHTVHHTTVDQHPST